MPKFHFDIIDSHPIKDPKGMNLATEQQAKQIAEEMAKQVTGSVEDASLKDVVVKNETAEVIHMAPIKNDSNT